jgi:hypothetical protein
MIRELASLTVNVFPGGFNWPIYVGEDKDSFARVGARDGLAWRPRSGPMSGHNLGDGFGQNPAPPQTNQALRRRKTQVICAGTGQTDQAGGGSFRRYPRVERLQTQSASTGHA